MNAQAPIRGAELVAGGGRIGAGPRWLARIWSGGINRILDRIDAGLERGAIEGELPDGSFRLLGGRKPGFVAKARLNSPMGLLRLATGGSVGWYQAWEAGEWESPRSGAAVRAVHGQRRGSLGDAGRARGPWRLAVRFAALAAPQYPRRGAAQRPRALRSRQRFLCGLAGHRPCAIRARMFADARASGRRSEAAACWPQDRNMLAIIDRLDIGRAKSVLEIGCGWGRLLAILLARFGAPGHCDQPVGRATGLCAAALGRRCDGGSISASRTIATSTGQFDAIASVEMVEAVGPRILARLLGLHRSLPQARRARGDPVHRDARRPVRRLRKQRRLHPDLYLSRRHAGARERIPPARRRTRPGMARPGLISGRTMPKRCGSGARISTGRWRRAGCPPGFDARFVRLWRYYLMYCEGGFRGGGIDVAQVTLVKHRAPDRVPDTRCRPASGRGCCRGRSGSAAD